MFYPLESLRKGGRFYLCWIADSWPVHFTKISPKQLWSQDIRKICDDLLELITNESGITNERFSLRLSSQLLRGLVRLYQRKTIHLIGNLYTINATVSKKVNKKYLVHIDEIESEKDNLLQPLERFVLLQELPDDVQRIEELLEDSNNIVHNIQDITLKESTLPAYQPRNDGFGEENPEQTIQMMDDRTIETMLHQTDTPAAHSGLDIALETTNRKSQLIAPDVRVERMSEHNITVFGRDISDIPEIPPPEVPVPQIDIQEKAPESMIVAPKLPQAKEKEQPKELEETELEEIEEFQTQPRKRRAKKLIIDKKIQLSSNYIRSRLNNVALDLRCENRADDIIKIYLPWEEYAGRPCHAGRHNYSHLGIDITYLFKRNLNIVSEYLPVAERELQEAMPLITQAGVSMPLETVIEEVEPTLMEGPQPQMQETLQANVSKESLINVTVPRVSAAPMQMDIGNLPTATPLQQGKRSAQGGLPSPKKRRSMGVMHSQQWLPRVVIEKMGNKENIPEFSRQPQTTRDIQITDVIQMLQRSGLTGTNEIEEVSRRSKEGSETPLGSLDKTKVSLGDSVETTESMKFLRDQWGTVGTMSKIYTLAKANYFPITVEELISKEPVVPKYEKFIAAKCFYSILKLKQHGFINVQKDNVTLAIRHITLGRALKNYL